MSFMGLSSAAARLDDRWPHRRHRWMTAHLPPFRTQTPTGSMIPPQSAARSPGSVVHVEAVQAVGAVVAASAAGGLGDHQAAAHAAGKAVIAGVGL